MSIRKLVLELGLALLGRYRIPRTMVGNGLELVA
jgi:hypothetical protein